MRFTGDARYGDWIERLVYNGVGAMVPMNDYGMIMYGSKYSVFGAQKMHSTVWFCCQGSLLQNIGDYSSLIYFKDHQNLYVNLFVPSRVTWQGPEEEENPEQRCAREAPGFCGQGYSHVDQKFRMRGGGLSISTLTFS